jgi:hypothetical protein
MLPEAPISPEAFSQGSSAMKFVVRATSDYHVVGALGGSVLLRPLGWGFSDPVGCHIIPDSSPRACGGVEHSFRGLRTSDHG